MIELKGGPLYRWEIGRTVSGFIGDVAQFYNSGDSVAMSVAIENPGEEVRIPDRYLATGKPVVVCDVETGTNDEETVLSVRVFPVKARARPKDYTPTKAEEAYGAVKKLRDEAEGAAQTSEEAARVAGEYAKEAKEAVGDLAPLFIETSIEFGELPLDIEVEEIYQAAEKGREVVLFLTDGDYKLRAYLSAASPDYAVFTGSDPNDEPTTPTFYIIRADRKIYMLPSYDEETVLSLIARGGNGNIDMGDERWIRTGSVSAPVLQVASSDAEGFFLKAGDYEGSNAVAEFSDTFDDMFPVILRNVAPGTQDHDAVVIDQVCPGFNESGLVVQCEPVEGYPLVVDTEDSPEGSVSMVICGKNLYNAKKYPMTNGRMIRHGAGTFASSGVYSATEDYIPVSHLRGKTISIHNAPANTNGASTTGGIAFYHEDQSFVENSGSNREQVVVPEDAVYMRFSVNTDYVNEAQIEIGTKVTDYEAYREKAVEEVQFPCRVPAPAGLNTVFCLDDGISALTISVTGKSDPKAKIQKLYESVEELKNALVALGANI